MSRQRFLLLAVAAVIVIGVASLLAAHRDASPRPAQGTALLPVVSQELGSVTEVDIRKGSATPTVTLRRAAASAPEAGATAPGSPTAPAASAAPASAIATAPPASAAASAATPAAHDALAAWTVAQRADYPADAAKVRRLLISLGDAKIVETKTTDPANFAVIGVDDPSQPGAQGTEIGILAKDGKHSVIIGKPVAEGDFARRGGDNQSYTIEPGVSAEADPKSWIDTKLLDLPTASIQSVVLRPPAGTPGYGIHRLKPNEDGFGLDGAVPAGRQLIDAKALAPSSTTFSGLDAEDVGVPEKIDFGKSTQAIYTLTDGSVLTVTGVAANDKRWIEVQSSKDAALNGKAQNRAFEIASYRYDALFRPLEQLLVPKEPPKNAKEPKSAQPALSVPGARKAPQSPPASP